MIEILLTKEQVLDAVKVFPEAKEAFKRVAPQAFEDEWEDITDKVHCFLHQHANDSWDIHFTEQIIDNETRDWLGRNLHSAFGWMDADGGIEMKDGKQGNYKIAKHEYGDGRFLRIFKKR